MPNPERGEKAAGESCTLCGLPRDRHFNRDEWPQMVRWHCAKCGKPMQFADGICFDCNGGRDPGD